MRKAIAMILCVLFSCIITAAEKCGVDWGD